MIIEFFCYFERDDSRDVLISLIERESSTYLWEDGWHLGESDIFNRVQGRVDCRHNIENAWFLVNMILKGSLEIPGSVFRVEEAEIGDFFLVNGVIPGEGDASSRGYLYNGELFLQQSEHEELEGVRQLRANCTIFTEHTKELLHAIPKTNSLLANSCHSMTVRLPERVFKALEFFPELVPKAVFIACEETFKETSIDQVCSTLNDGTLVDCELRFTRLSKAALRNYCQLKSTDKADSEQDRNRLGSALINGISRLIVANDEFERDLLEEGLDSENLKVRSQFCHARYEQDSSYISYKPLRAWFTRDILLDTTPNTYRISKPALDFSKEQEMEQEDVPFHNDQWNDLGHAWETAFQEEEEDGELHQESNVLHESQRPIIFSADEFLRILGKSVDE